MEYRQDLKKRIDELIAFREDLTCYLTEYDEHYVRADDFILEFKPGIELEINE